MLENSTFLQTLLISLVLNKMTVISAEWVEIPQFSDESKVYRLSSNRHDSYYNKFLFSNYKVIPSYDVRNISELKDFGDLEKKAIEEDVKYQTENPTKFTTITPFELADASQMSEEPEVLEIHEDENTDDDVDVEIEDYLKNEEDEPSQMESPTRSLTTEPPKDEVLTTTSTTTTSTPMLTTEDPKENTLNNEKYNNKTVEDKGFLEYLPIEMLKKVHQTLKSQPSTLKGKIRFLKRFEKSLMTEIEFRLSAALAPARKTRGAHEHYEHGYEDHKDDSIGFPSLEAALLAISFLTFAVYLVRLVMQLFRQFTSSPTTAATLLFGRRRRSVDDTMENTAKILSYLDTFPSNY